MCGRGVILAHAMLRAALARRVSAGAHYRWDCVTARCPSERRAALPQKGASRSEKGHRLAGQTQ